MQWTSDVKKQHNEISFEGLLFASIIVLGTLNDQKTELTIFFIAKIKFQGQQLPHFKDPACW